MKKILGLLLIISTIAFGDVFVKSYEDENVIVIPAASASTVSTLITTVSNAFVAADALKINKINGTATDLYIINELNFTNVSYGTTASIGSMESGYFKYIHNTAVKFLSPFQFNFSTNVYISGNLDVVQIPTAGTGVGNRDYNDARYAGIAYTNSVLRVALNGTTNTPTAGLVDLGTISGGGSTNLTDLSSGAATDGYVATADGAGGIAWEIATSPTSGITQAQADLLYAPISDGVTQKIASGKLWQIPPPCDWQLAIKSSLGGESYIQGSFFGSAVCGTEAGGYSYLRTASAATSSFDTMGTDEAAGYAGAFDINSSYTVAFQFTYIPVTMPATNTACRYIRIGDAYNFTDYTNEVFGATTYGIRILGTNVTLNIYTNELHLFNASSYSGNTMFNAKLSVDGAADTITAVISQADGTVIASNSAPKQSVNTRVPGTVSIGCVNPDGGPTGSVHFRNGWVVVE